MQSFLNSLEASLVFFGEVAWGPWLLILILGGGLFFLWRSKFLPFRYLGHGLAVLSGKYDRADSPGDITHFQALSSALAGTIGMGNIAGVAVAIYVGGPGAVFWMWMTAIVGIATKFFTCTLAVMYRGKDSAGNIQGGPMYVIVEGLGQRWKPLAVFFSTAGLIGCLPLFQTNQLIQTVREVIFIHEGYLNPAQSFEFNLLAGVILAATVSMVIFGGVQRIATVASRLVPGMALLYLLAVAYILISNYQLVPASFALIFVDAFTGMAAAGGAIGTVIATGVRRGAFSNEAGIGTEALAHGAAKTNEPVREGLVAMIGPIIDTLLICTATALVILISGVWQASDANGVTMTAAAFDKMIPGVGRYILIICIACFSVTTIFSYTYYGSKCLGFLAGAERQHYYNYLVVIMTVFAAVMSLDAMVGLVDGAFALMAIPTTISALLLSKHVMIAAKEYFHRLDQEDLEQPKQA
ncbi:MAG: alanine/glycine:cation symporter family protein [Pseudomonadales bacterium]